MIRMETPLMVSSVNKHQQLLSLQMMVLNLMLQVEMMHGLSSSYLNIWVGNLGGGLLGYAQFPGGAAATDGVVLLNGTVGGPGALGTAAPYNRGRTATHEIGHWLNLRHIWGDSNCGNDFVADTPTQQAALNFGCPSFPQISCSNGPNGEMYMNYMDYTDDACMYMFSDRSRNKNEYHLLQHLVHQLT